MRQCTARNGLSALLSSSSSRRAGTGSLAQMRERPESTAETGQAVSLGKMGPRRSGGSRLCRCPVLSLQSGVDPWSTSGTASFGVMMLSGDQSQAAVVFVGLHGLATVSRHASWSDSRMPINDMGPLKRWRHTPRCGGVLSTFFFQEGSDSCKSRIGCMQCNSEVRYERGCQYTLSACYYNLRR